MFSFSAFLNPSPFLVTSSLVLCCATPFGLCLHLSLSESLFDEASFSSSVLFSNRFLLSFGACSHSGIFIFPRVLDR